MVVEWTNEPNVRKMQATLARTIIKPPLLIDGDQDRVKMGKSTSAREWKAIFRGLVDDSIEMERTTCEAIVGDEDVTKEPEKAAVCGRKRLAGRKAGGKKQAEKEEQIAGNKASCNCQSRLK